MVPAEGFEAPPSLAGIMTQSVPQRNHCHVTRPNKDDGDKTRFEVVQDNGGEGTLCVRASDIAAENVNIIEE